MNHVNPLEQHGCATLDDRWIDHLVDGELTPEDRRRVLLALASEPDGWRRCALAFLEAQTWSASVRELADHSTDFAPTVPQPPVRSGLGRASARWGLAACLLIASFAAGLGTGRSFPMSGVAPVPRPSAGGSAIADRTGEPTDLAQSTPTAWDPQQDMPTSIPADESASSLLLEDVPSYLITLWQRQGFDVEQIQRTHPVVLTNGGQIELPIRDVRLRYVGNDPL